MSKNRLDIDGGVNIVGIVTGYAKEVIEENVDALTENCMEAANKAARLLRQRSRKRTGSFRKGWKVSTKKGTNFVDCIVHNRVYTLTHLLENDHAIRNQTGKTYGTVRGDKAVSRVYDEVSAEFGKAGDGS